MVVMLLVQLHYVSHVCYVVGLVPHCLVDSLGCLGSSIYRDPYYMFSFTYYLIHCGLHDSHPPSLVETLAEPFSPLLLPSSTKSKMVSELVF